MTQPQDTFLLNPNPSDPGERSSGRSGWFYWLLAVCTAVALHLLIGYALFVAALPCAQAAWRSFRCGFWLRRADPNAARGRACWWFYLAVGFWRAAATAFVVFIAFIEIQNHIDRRMARQRLPLNNPAGQNAIGELPREFVPTMATIVSCLCISSLVGIVATAVAFRTKVRVWANPGLRERCHGDFNRLLDYARAAGTNRNNPVNHAVPVLFLSLYLPVLVAGCVLFICLLLAERLLISLCGLACLVTALLAMLPLYDLLRSRITAGTPADCWPSES